MLRCSMTIVEDRHLSVSNSADLFTQSYQVVDYRCSESAFVFFAHNLKDKEKQVAIKILRECDDTRYNLTNAEKRYQCQIDALRWNRLFTPEIEIGLCLVVEEGLEALTGQILLTTNRLL